jgi:prephenate dehydrogenase
LLDESAETADKRQQQQQPADEARDADNNDHFEVVVVSIPMNRLKHPVLRGNPELKMSEIL